MAYQYYSPFQNPYMQPQYQYQPQSLYQMQQQIPNQMQMNQIPQQAQQIQQLNGQMVDSIEAVKAKDVDLSGNPVFYPNVNGNEIYKKQLMVDGTSKIVVYKAVDSEIKCDDSNQKESYITSEQFTKSICELKDELISEIKKIFI